jgi:hypothetical protein
MDNILNHNILTARMMLKSAQNDLISRIRRELIPVRTAIYNACRNNTLCFINNSFEVKVKDNIFITHFGEKFPSPETCQKFLNELRVWIKTQIAELEIERLAEVAKISLLITEYNNVK